MFHRKFLFLALLFPILLTNCICHKPSFVGTPWPSKDVGFSQNDLADINESIKENAYTTGMVVIKNGEKVFEYGDIDKVSYIASCRKSVLSMLYGKYVMDGTIDLNQQIGALGIDEDGGLLPVEKHATIDHIITSRSGVFHVPANGGYDKKNVLERGSVKPGEYFVYNNWDFNVGGYILEYYTKQTIYEVMEEQLAIPLGFQDWNIQNQKKYHNKKKSRYPAYHIYISTRDMAKIGQLMLNKGCWDGRQLIPEKWIEKTVTTVTPRETLVERYGDPGYNGVHYSYGYMWWLIDDFKGSREFEGAYSAKGYGGQYITVLPAVNMVIAHKTKLDLVSNLGLAYHDTPEHVYFSIIEKLLSLQK